MTEEKRIERLEDAFLTLNKEMGVVQGELTWIRRLLTAILGIMATGVGYLIFGG